MMREPKAASRTSPAGIAIEHQHVGAADAEAPRRFLGGQGGFRAGNLEPAGRQVVLDRSAVEPHPHHRHGEERERRPRVPRDEVAEPCEAAM